MSLLGSVGQATGLWGGGGGSGAGTDIYKQFLSQVQGVGAPTNEDIQKQYSQQSPEGRKAQMQALQGLSDISKTGMTAQDVENNAKMMQRTQGALAGANKATQANMAARGMSGGGASLAAKLSNASNADQIGNLAGVSNAANAQASRMNALQGMMSGGGAVRSGDIDQANAADQIRNFNFQNQMQKMGVMGQGISGLSQAQQGGAERSARFLGGIISDVNAKTDIESADKSTMSKIFDRLGAGFSGAGAVNPQQPNTQPASNPWTGTRDQVMSMAPAAAAMFSDKRAKEDVHTLPEQMLDKLHGYTYEYKDPERHGYGTQIGVMAQDLEKSPMGESMVGESPDGFKTVDSGKAAMGALAGLANINDRLKALEEKKNA